MKICITGAQGYVGSSLVPYLLKQFHHITALDIGWFGDHLQDHLNLRKINGDIRDKETIAEAFRDQDIVIHLACVSNDPSFDMNPILGKTINLDCFKMILEEAERAKIDHFIYASSSSVYGVSDLPEVTEESLCNPLTDYSKYKLKCEEILHDSDVRYTILRPATVCGYSPRMRLDLVVNALSIHALINKKIIVHGGEQIRPNISIKDMVRAYARVLENGPIQDKFNVGGENFSVSEIARIVKNKIEHSEIEIQSIIDQRSYRINSTKFRDRFKCYPKFTISDAVGTIEIANTFSYLKNPMTNPEYYNIKRMKELFT